jgi:hypothetical protein
MARAALPIGTEKETPQGYIRVRVAYNLSETGWAFKHHMIAWEKLGRQHNPEIERVIFKDGDKRNYAPGNIVVVPKGDVASQKAKRIIYLKARIQEMSDELTELEREDQVNSN